MPLVNSTGFSHVRLTVTDIHRSKAFYDAVFGWPVAIDASGKVDEPGVKESPEHLFGGVIYQTPQGSLLGLRPVGSSSFDSTTNGLDHVSFAVDSVEELDRAAAALSEAGIAHGEVKRLDRSGIAILSFQDPDDINLELTAPLG
jgi:catechol 2,3-dioxygenase-like lactoylglutathione lyase family enzyme